MRRGAVCCTSAAGNAAPVSANAPPPAPPITALKYAAKPAVQCTIFVTECFSCPCELARLPTRLLHAVAMQSHMNATQQTHTCAQGNALTCLSCWRLDFGMLACSPLTCPDISATKETSALQRTRVLSCVAALPALLLPPCYGPCLRLRRDHLRRSMQPRDGPRPRPRHETTMQP